MAVKLININGLQFYHRNQTEFEELYTEIFQNHEYAVNLPYPPARIIDCGSHIGISVAYFKQQFPTAQIIAFEPVSVNYSLLRRNIRANGWHDILPVNAGVSGKTGNVTFYGQFSGKAPRTVGNSILEAWGMGTVGIQERRCLKTVQLSSYLTEPVDLLKLDIEGAEEEVLWDIQPYLHNVTELHMEYHSTSVSNDRNNLDNILNILDSSGFSFEVEHKNIAATLPRELKHWIDDYQPHMAIVRAVNRCLAYAG